MTRARAVLRFPLSESDIDEALRMHDATGAEVVCKPRATMRPPAMSAAHALDMFAEFDAIHAAGLRVARAVEDSSKRETVRPPRRMGRP